jgi:hypothetical protein
MQKGNVIIFFLVILAIIFALGGALFYPEWQGFKENEGRLAISNDIGQLSGKVAKLSSYFAQKPSLSSSSFEPAVLELNQFDKFLKEEKVKLSDYSPSQDDLRSNYLLAVSEIQVAIGDVLNRANFLNGIRNDFLKMKGEEGFLHKLSFKDGVSEKERIFSLKDEAVKMTDYLKATNFKGEVSFWGEQWLELVTLRRNYLAALSESITYNVSYQWTVAQYRYPVKEEEVFGKFEEVVSGWTGNGDWLKLTKEAVLRIR